MATGRRRQGGSRARRAAVANAALVHHPEIRRGIPVMEVTNREGIELIHDFAMRVIEEIGCDFQPPGIPSRERPSTSTEARMPDHSS